MLPPPHRPVLQHSHIPAVPIWKSRTSPTLNVHAVSPRIPTSPQQTTAAAIYTYLFMYFVVAVIPASIWLSSTAGYFEAVLNLLLARPQSQE